MVLTNFSWYQILNCQGIDGENESMVVVPHGIAREVPSIAQRREPFFLHTPFAFRLVRNNVGRDVVKAV